jgi:glycosyltransferase involved in cell wall biosynthesis
MNPNSKILIGMPNASGQVPTIMLQSMLQLYKPCPSAFMAVERQRVDKARNVIAMEALSKGFDYLLFVDDDNPIPPDTLEKMLEDDKDIVIATILGRNPDKTGKHPLCAFYSEEVKDCPAKIYRPIEKFKDEGYLHRIDGGGCGCMLIKRKVLEALYLKYKDYIFEFGDIRFDKKIMVDGVEYDRRTMSEDCEFSERAINCGFEMWLDERIKPMHISGSQFIQYGGI